ncbi:uncharacterized protein LOC132203868 [Neocloeon triangulifer]|uniref:uncharacterized protein LOC132203868 n=1 Tax=Neocloeon triangulifer TaxID=2078957 RepID=UPI00286F2E4B|nr:uncharacterized protein LOC132203868 [Neocloeon triangulifer]
MDKIFRSEISDNSHLCELENLTIANYALQRLKSRIEVLGDKPWLVDTVKGKEILFKDVECRARSVGSALSRRGFAKGDSVQIVSSDVVDATLLQTAVWLIGGFTRNCCTDDSPEEIARQMKQIECKFVVADKETMQKVTDVLKLLDFKCSVITIGDNLSVKNSVKFTDLISDDGSAFPETEIDGREDAILVCNTSGSTGHPKGVVHTHHSILSTVAVFEGNLPIDAKSDVFLCTNTFTISYAWMCIVSLAIGFSVHTMGKFKKELLLEHLLKYRTPNVSFYPYIGSWFVRILETTKHDFSFIKEISFGGGVLDTTTFHILKKYLPNVAINQTYASTECLGIAKTFNKDGKKLNIKITPEGESLASNGFLFPSVEVKIADFDTGELLDENQLGKLYVRSKFLLKGYLGVNGKMDRSCLDAEGWFDTGDMAFVDEEGELFVRERVSFMFVYINRRVIPSEIEALLLEHPAVQMVCVLGVPHVDTNYQATAFVVLKRGKLATEDELKRIVARKLPEHKHLHGGVQFVESLPENRGGKLDRIAVWKKHCHRFQA